MKDTTAIITIAYPEIEKNIKNNNTKYKKYMSSFISVRSDKLYSNIVPCQQMYFTNTDCDELYKNIGVDRNKINNAISNTYYNSIPNFNPPYAKDDITITLLCLIRYYKLKNMKKELELAMINLAFSGKFFPSIWYGSFPIAAPQEHIMEYVITNMCSNKFDIVREGNLIGAIKSICYTWLNTYQSRLKDFHDDDVVYLVQQLHSRIRSFMNNIAELYYDAYEHKDIYITYDSDDVSEDNYHLADSDSLRLERAVSSTMNNINNHGIDYRICKMASNDLVKVDELKSIIENLLSNPKNTILIKEFITLLVVCYFKESKTKDVRDLDFISFSIKAKPNTKDQYVLRQKELLNILLLNNSEHFNRRKNRDATAQAYYRAMTAYFALIIQESNK